MILVPIVTGLGASAAPHLLGRPRLSPFAGITMWLSVLAMRALGLSALALLLVNYLPSTGLFQNVTRWCLHAIVPFVLGHLDFSGHRLGEMAVLIPTLSLPVSLAIGVLSVYRSREVIRRWLAATVIGGGPRQSVVVPGAEVIVAAAGLHRARVVVSTGALAALDPAELRAGIEHEQGHIERRHSYIRVLAHLLFRLGRLAPGSRAALRELEFYLERDADEFAVARTGEPLALATTIGKAATPPASRSGLALAHFGGADTPTRLRLLLDRQAAVPSRPLNYLVWALTATICLGVIALGFTVPGLLQAGLAHTAEASLRCAL